MRTIISRFNILYVFLFVLFIQNGVAQNVETPIAAPNNSSSGNGLVDMVTGDFNYTLPLTKLSDRGFDVPISLSYAGSGILVSQPASEVGLGWSLNAGGYIRRELRGFPDDQIISGGYNNPDYIGWLYDKGTTPLSSTIANFVTAYNNDAEETIVSEEINDLLYSDDKTYDMEPDIYTYNILGRTGSFLFGTKLGYNQTHPIVLIPYYPIKVEFELSDDESDGLLWFKIIDENGVEYLFEEREITRSNSRAEVQETVKVNGYLYNASLIEQEYASAWYLTKITNTFNHHVDFTYQPFKQYFDNSFYEEYRNYDLDGNFEDAFNKTRFNGYVQCREPFVLEKHIKTIEGPNTKIEFNYFEKRKDINELTSYLHPSALNEIVISQKIGESYTRKLRRFNFDYDYFTIPENHNYPLNVFNSGQAATKRLRLDGITVYNGTEALPPYQFEYDYSKENYRFLPSRYSFAKDFWGYNNMKFQNNNSVPDLWVFPIEMGYRRFFILGGYFNTFSYYWKGANMQPDPNTKQIGSLTKVFFPNGGYLGITYETDTYRISDIDHNFNGGGIRVKELHTYDGLTTEHLTKSYKYTEFDDSQKSSGRVTSLPVYGFFDPQHEPFSNSNWAECIYVRTNVDLNTIDNEIVLYENVKETIVGSGYSEFTFNIPGQMGDQIDNMGPFEVPSVGYVRDAEDITNTEVAYKTLLSDKLEYPYLNNLNYDWNRGLLEKVEQYTDNGVKVQSTNLEYVIHYPNDKTNYDPVYGLKVGFLKNNEDELEESLIALGKYKIATNISKKLFKKEVRHLGQANAYTTTTFLYNADGFVSEAITIDGVNQNSSIKFKYVSDYFRGIDFYDPILPSSDSRSVAIVKMFQKHNISKAIETTYYKNGKVTSAIIDMFKPLMSGSNIVVPSESWVLETETPVPSYTQSLIWNLDYSFLFAEILFEKVAQFNHYDESGNLLDANVVENLYNANIYSYNNTFPVASIQNARNIDEIVGISCGYIGFENANLDVTADNNYWFIGSYGEIVSSDAHTGLYSCKLDNVVKAAWSNIKTFYPEDQKRKFDYSAWVKNEIGLPDYSAGIGYELYDLNDQVISGTWNWVSFKNTGGEWLLISQIIDLEQLKQDNNITGDVKIKCFAVNYDATHYMLIDDIRFVPTDAFMTTYTYDPGIGVTSVTDANNLTKSIVYDELGRKKNVIDHKGNTVNNYEYNLANNQLKISDRVYDFGGMEINMQNPLIHTIVFSNAGKEVITIETELQELEMTGFNLPEYPSPHCGGEIVLQPGTTYELDVLFRPTSYGPKNATLKISSLQKPYNTKIYLSGSGGGVYFHNEEFEYPSWVAFGNNQSEQLAFSNKYSEPIEVTFSITGSSDFSINMPNTTITIPGNGQVEIPVVFSPTGITSGYRNAVLIATIPDLLGVTVIRTMDLSAFAYHIISFTISGPINVDCSVPQPKYTYNVTNLSGDVNKPYDIKWYVMKCNGNYKELLGQNLESMELEIFKGDLCYNDRFEIKCIVSQVYDDYQDYGKSTSTSEYIYSFLPGYAKCIEMCDF